MNETESVPVLDYNLGSVADCKVTYAEEIDDYGMFYLVDHPSEYVDDPMAVIVSESGMQFTTDDWQGFQPQSAAEVPEFRWVDASGAGAIMLDGLPHSLCIDNDIASRIAAIDKATSDE